jgi:hypothetical protein
VTTVTPGGLADRAGLRDDDVVWTPHGGGARDLLWALERASRGRQACIDVVNGGSPSRYRRQICFGTAD